MAIAERMSNESRKERLNILMSMKAMARVDGLGMLPISLTRLPTRSLRRACGLRCCRKSLENSRVMMVGSRTTLSVRSMTCR